MKHVDLFSGIGGFALAVDTVWPGSQHVFCDFDPFCQQILKKHWPTSKIYDDIRTLTYPESERAEGRDIEQQIQNPQPDEKNKPAPHAPGGQPGQSPEWEGWKNISGRNFEADILTGGFPCQPFSAAGKRRGTEDNRYLWPEMFRIIRTFKPTWVIAENVRGLATWNEGMVLEQVCTDLERETYEVQPLIIPAVAVNAPHRRDRIWFIAYRTGDRQQRQRTAPTFEKGRATGSEQPGQLAGRPEGSYSHATDTDAGRIRRQQREGVKEIPIACGGWQSDWYEVATELCGVDDGLPAELDGFKLSKAGHRAARLKALGNAIVPQVAIEIMKAIQCTAK